MLLAELFESRSANLYHGTNLASLVKMLETNIMKRGIYRSRFISFSRDSGMSINFAVGKADEQTGLKSVPVMLVMDQELLYRKFGKKLRPYNDLDTEEHGNTARSGSGSESEEALYSDIHGVNSFIKQIVIQMPVNKYRLGQLAPLMHIIEPILQDPRTVVRNFTDKNITGRQFLKLIDTQKQ